MANNKVMNNNLPAAASLPPPPPVDAVPVLLFVVWVWALITCRTLHVLLATRTMSTTSRWTAAAADVLVWVALAATAGMHYTEVASDRIFLAADPGDTYTFVDAVFASVSLAVTLLVASFLLCCSCSPRRLELGEHRQGDHDGEV